MSVLTIVIITVLVYSAITCFIFIVSNEDEDVAAYLAIGLLGIILIPGIALIKKLIWLKRFGGKRSIIFDNAEDKHYWCKISDADDFSGWFNRYKLITRYAPKEEWRKYDKISKEKIDKSKQNCDHCAINCAEYYGTESKCKTDAYEFFKPKSKNRLK
jgi:hypothetical protein